MNTFTRYLIHSTADAEKGKALKRNATAALNEWFRNETKLGAQAEPSTQDQINENNTLMKRSNDADKALANHEWYEHNKQWKKEYNAEYYQKNKDYWKERYTEASNKYKEAEDRETDTGDGESYNTSKAAVERNIAEINLERAKKEYDNFISSQKEYVYEPLFKLREPQGHSLIDRGVGFISTVLTPILKLFI